MDTIFLSGIVSLEGNVTEMGKEKNITRLLAEIKWGKSESYNSLFSIVYDQLKEMAYIHLRFRGGGQNHTISKTELVHEAYIKLLDYKERDLENRAHFYALASQCMRHILVDIARKKSAEKRGGNKRNLTLYEDRLNIEDHAEHLIDLNRLIDEMAAFDKRKSQIVEMKFFAGMTIPEIAEVLDVSTRTVDRDWLKARTWLLQKLKS